ncbi:MAG: phage protein NinX family protein [Hafnia sp.]
MTDYSKMSDDEINVKVGECIGFAAKLMAVNKDTDYCNNPSDAWPVIIKNRISMVWDCAEDASSEWWNAVDQYDDFRIQYQSNPLRAAMIVYLMMKESENG